MNKKITSLFCAVILVLSVLSGCGGGRESNFNEGVVMNSITTALNLFESGVQDFNVTNMLDNFSTEADFVLTIKEGNWSYDKNYDDLHRELEEDAPAQQSWRKPVSEGGHNYALDLILGTLVFANLNENGGFATQTFEVWESAEGIPLMKTDNGNIIWQVVKKAGLWTVVSINIEFQALTASYIPSRDQGFSSNRGFGFGIKSWGNN